MKDHRDSSSLNRRRFLRHSAVGLAGVALGPAISRAAESAGRAPDDLVASVTREVIFRGRESGPTWFHPRACMVPEKDGARALMTLQTIGGSDYFGPVHYTDSTDVGRTWSQPRPITAFARRKLADGSEEGVCDVVPEYHLPTRCVLAMGHNVFYRDGRFFRRQPPRQPVYAVRRPDGSWSERKTLAWDDPRGAFIYTNNCGQRVTLPRGDVLFVMSFGAEEQFRSAAGVICAFDGESLRIRAVGREMKHRHGRGLLEPSVTQFQGRFFVTLRAEDNHGYVAVSEDGLEWSDKQPWSWDNDEPLTMSTTQQHWLPHAEALVLVYTRKSEQNVAVMRWRAPLYMARVDPRTLRLIRATERIVLPLIGDGVKDAQRVARMGNFHTVAASPEESWVTVGETLPAADWRGDTLLARIRWRIPNRRGG